jgi:hypothetical protein
MKMGNSLHNKIYLGRANLLVDIKRVKAAACVAAAIAAGTALMYLTTFSPPLLLG